MFLIHWIKALWEKFVQLFKKQEQKVEQVAQVEVAKVQADAAQAQAVVQVAEQAVKDKV